MDRMSGRIARTGIVLVYALCCGSAGAQVGKDGKANDPVTYQEALREKVGEVAEIQYKELVGSDAGRVDGEKALLRLAQYQFFRGDFAGSEYYLRKIIKRYEHSPSMGEARLLLGRSYLARGERRATLIELRRGLKLLESAGVEEDDLMGRYLFWIGEAHLRDGKTSDARYFFEKLFDEYPDHPLSGVLRKKLREVYRSLGLPGALERLDRVGEKVGGRSTSAKPEEGEGSSPRKGRYLIQVASFVSRVNAREMVGSLKSIGLEATIREASLDEGIRYRVVLEGFSDKTAAEKIVEKLEKEGYGHAILEDRK